MPEIPVIVAVADRADFDKIKAACESHGLRNVSALPRLGLLKGHIDDRHMADLAALPGVLSVEKEREIQLPPRGSPIQ